MPLKKTRALPKGTDAAGSDRRSRAATVPKEALIPGQLQSYERGMRLFHAGQFREARDQFLQSLVGPERDIAHRAELHVRMCDRRLEKQRPVLSTAEDHYNYGVALLNARDLGGARRHLEAALGMDGKADHVHYALALCRAIAGDLQGAYEDLKRAIELQPRNRIIARQDDDFARFANQPPLDRLLGR